MLKLLKSAAIVFNALAAIMHLAFQFYLLKNAESVTYTQFLLTENILISFVLLLSCISLIRSDFSAGFIKYNIAFWIFFLISVSMIRPENTTLDLVNIHFPIKQWLLLFIIGTVTLLVNIMIYIKIRKKN